MGSFVEKWNGGDRSLPVATKYFAFNKNSKGEFEGFFNGLSETQKLDSMVFEMLHNVRPKLDSDVFKFMVKHREDYQKVAYNYMIARTIDNRIDWDMQESFGTDQFDKVVEKYKKMDFKKLDIFAKRAEWTYFLKKGDFVAFRKSAKEFITEFSKKNSYVYNELIFKIHDMGEKAYSTFRNSEMLIDWGKKAKESMKDSTQFSFAQFYAYIIVGDIDRVKEIANDYLISIEGKNDYTSTSDREYIESILNDINLGSN